MPKKRFAVFLDRDGVINVEVLYLHRLKDLKILPGIPAAIKLLNQFKIPAIVITNQPVVARGWLTEASLERIHQKIEKILAKKGSRINRFYFCPHHPQADLPRYRIVCDCRKPATKLFEKAANDFKIDLEQSYCIGDSFRDIEAGKKVGCTTIFVRTGGGDIRESKPDYFFPDLLEAIKFILKKEGLA